MDIAAWLRSLGLEQYEAAFRENDIDAGVLPQLTAEDLSGLGVASIGHRRKLLVAIVSLNSGALDQLATTTASSYERGFRPLVTRPSRRGAPSLESKCAAVANVTEKRRCAEHPSAA